MPPVDELAISRKKNLKKMQKNLGATERSNATGRISTLSGSMGKSHSAIEQSSETRGPPLTTLDFNNLNINESFTFQFKIRNLSGIGTSYRLFFDNYGSIFQDSPRNQLSTQGGDLANQNNPLDMSFSRSKNQSKNFSIHSDSIQKGGRTGGTGFRKLTLLNDKIDSTHVFYSENGMKATQEKQFQTEAEQHLKNGKGLALVCQPAEGNLPPHAETTITIKVFNELSGTFQDNLNCQIKGLELTKFPVTVTVMGSPLKIPTDQVGLKIQSVPPVLDFGGKIRDGNPLERQFKLSNIGTQPLEVELKVFNIDTLDKRRDQFRIKITSSRPGQEDPFSVIWEGIEPENTDEKPFWPEKYSITIPPKSIVPVKVTFNSDEISDYNSVMTCTPRFITSQEHLSKVELDQLSVLLKARTLVPMLSLHEQPNINGDISFKFHKWSVGRAPKQTRNILLLNELPCHLYFDGAIEGPFSFLGNTSGAEDFSQERISQLLDTNDKALVKQRGTEKYNQKYKELTHLDIVESSNMGLLLNFEGYDPMDFDHWPNTRAHFLSGVLKLVFRNGETQSIKLEGCLYRPFLFLNSTGFEPCDDPSETPTLDFGLSHIEDSVTTAIWLCNKSPVPAQWKIVYVPFPQKDYFGACTTTKLEKENVLKRDDPEVFSFDCSEGNNPGNNIGVNMVPSGNAFWTRTDNHGVFKELYPKKINILFKPKANILYKSLYKIVVRGGPSIQFMLKGKGSYEEKFKKKM